MYLTNIAQASIYWRSIDSYSALVDDVVPTPMPTVDPVSVDCNTRLDISVEDIVISQNPPTDPASAAEYLAALIDGDNSTKATWSTVPTLNDNTSYIPIVLGLPETDTYVCGVSYVTDMGYNMPGRGSIHISQDSHTNDSGIFYSVRDFLGEGGSFSRYSIGFLLDS